MRIADKFAAGRPLFSFEFFPPKTDAGFASLYETIADLKELDPGFVSVTWGAGGSTRRKTVELVVQIQREIGLTAMAHLSCVGAERELLESTLDRLASSGVYNVLPLGGDRPEGYVPPPRALEHANELVELIRSRPDGARFSLAGACYPEVHPSAPDAQTDLRMLVQKVRAGVDFLITQLFFDNADYFDFVARAREAGIEVPIVPGIMPVISARNVRRMAALCQAKIPAELSSALDDVGEDDARTLEVGIEWARRQCGELLDRGAPGIHFYTLNRSPATRRICASLL